MSSRENGNSLTWDLVALTVCFTCPVLYRVSAESRAGECQVGIVSHRSKNRGACALTRAGGSLYTIKLKSACREPDLSLSGLDPVPLSKMGTHLLASLGNKGKKKTLACLRNAGFYSAESYCILGGLLLLLRYQRIWETGPQRPADHCTPK